MIALHAGVSLPPRLPPQRPSPPPLIVVSSIWKSRFHSLASIVPIALLLLFGRGCYQCFATSQSAVLIFEPKPQRVTIDEVPTTVSAEGLCDLHGLFGERLVEVRFDAKRTRRIAFSPRIWDDDSLSVTITPTKTIAYGKIRYRGLP